MVTATVAPTTSLQWNWRRDSPTGLLLTLSGGGIPRATPLAQSSAITHFLATKFGLAGATPAERAATDMLFDTARDIFPAECAHCRHHCRCTFASSPPLTNI